jgi:hypothetical protein
VGDPPLNWVKECHQGEGIAQAGGGLGAPLSELCTAVVDCVLRTECWRSTAGTGGVDLALCYTSSIDLPEPDGACRTEIEWAAEAPETGAAPIVNQNWYDPTFAIGRAVILLRCYSFNCAEACFPGSGT